jgi:type I restriction enzyme S subunit
MELKSGYKQTEVGVIPEEWETSTLKQVAEISAGINKPISEMGSGALYVTVQDLYDGRSIRIQRLGRIRVSPLEIHAKALVVGDIVFGKSSVKREGIGFPSQFLGGDEPVIFSGFTYRARALQRTADAVFLFYALRWNKTRQWLIDNSQASALTNINQSIADAIPIPLPPLPEQRAIAGVLGDVDALLGALTQLIAKKRDLKQAAMQQLLTGQTRLPGFRGSREMKRLGDVTDVDPDNLGSNTALNYAFNYISLEDVDAGVLRNYSEQVFRVAPSRARRRLQQGDVLVSTVRPNLQSHLLFAIDAPHWVCSTGFSVVRCRQGVTHPGYVFFHVFGHGVSRQIETLLTGSNYPAINSGDVRALEIPFPSYDEQTAIAAALSDMDAELAALEQRLAKTRALKQGMMQELLTGRTRLV